MANIFSCSWVEKPVKALFEDKAHSNMIIKIT